MTGPDQINQLDQLGGGSFINYSANQLSGATSGAQIIFIDSVVPVPTAKVTQAASQFPAGSVWYVVGEPNAQNIEAADLVVGLHDTYELIRSLDPTARITSPSLLNFKYTCNNTCGGYESGESWIENFRSSYKFLYGVEPPVDIWAIDTFPIDWDESRFPTVNSGIVTDQITQLRDYLSTVPEYTNTPIWVTEFGLHWGFTGLTFSSPGCSSAYPTGSYQTSAVQNYLTQVYNWLEANSNVYNIDAWYTFSSYRSLSDCHPDSGYGLTLFSGEPGGLELTTIGQFYWDWTHGLRP